MSTALVITPQARIDLAEHFAFIAADSLAAADRFLLASKDVFDNLAQWPELGRPREFRNPRLAGLRWLRIPGFNNYLVFYRYREQQVEVIRVLHGSRDVGRILEDGGD